MSIIKEFLKNIVIAILRFEARLVLKKYQPKVVGVTGSVGKTSTKDAVFAVLANKFKVRASAKSYNTDFGVPLTVLGCDNAWNDAIGWLEIMLHGLLLLAWKQDYPEWLVLEVGADRPGDIKRIVKWVKFDVGVVTRLPEVPVHIEFFKNKHQYLEEKLSLVRSLKETNWAVLNFDDSAIKEVSDHIKTQVIGYGFGTDNKIQASNVSLHYEGEKLAGLSFKINYNGDTLPIRLNGIVGQHQVYSALAAFGVGVSQGINLVDIADALSRMPLPPGRLRVLTGIKNTILLDDTYNASPAAMEAGLTTLAEIKTTGKKIAALADMLELGEHTIEAHRAIGRQVKGIVDDLVLVGLRAKFIGEGAIEAGFSEKHIHHFDDSVSAGKFIQDLMAEGDIVYLKGSQGMRMEKAVEEIMAEPEKKGELLVRQDGEWQKR
ncbi:MAG: UDP-N-acetylmuramoyl-tripeptide--D-alanyl-D-alanine ligase [Candidatus Paceibacterota bacterium]|jgi:UDP-N-acetylmuramoyl-tripeptide--D-alanyl-D-alanine ligase